MTFHNCFDDLGILQLHESVGSESIYDVLIDIYIIRVHIILYVFSDWFPRAARMNKQNCTQWNDVNDVDNRYGLKIETNYHFPIVFE